MREDGLRQVPPGGKVELHACLASTGEYLAILHLSASDTVADLCRAVAEEAALAKRGRCTFHAFVRGRFLDGCLPLTIANLRNKSSVDFVRCVPLSVLTVASDGTAKVFNAETGLCSVTIFSPRGASPGVLSPDASRMVSFTPQSTTAQISSVATGEHQLTLACHSGAVNAAAFSREGYHVGTASADGTAVIWNTRTGEQLQTLRGHEGEVHSITFSPDGHHVLTTSSDATARMWCVATGSPKLILAGHKWATTGAGFSPEGGWVVTASEDRTVKLWSVETGECIRTFEGHASPVVEASLSGCWDPAAAAELLQ